MASANPVRRSAVVAGVAFVVLSGAVGFSAYTQRDDAQSVAISGTDDTPITSAEGVGDSGVDSSINANTDAAETTSAESSAAGSTTTTAEIASTTTTEAATTTTETATSTTVDAVTTTTAPNVNSCPALDGSSPRQTSFSKPPPFCIDPRATYTAVMKTSEGEVKIALDPENAPKTVNNFVFLSRFHFYDGLTIHRVVPGFIIQGGDPLANSNGGPGYTFEDELPGKDGYEVGSVAMANSGANSNGSQFFVVTGPIGQSLKGTFSTFGKVTKGTSVLKAIDALGVAPGSNGQEFPPQRVITIESIEITSVGERPSRIPGLNTGSTTSTIG